MELSKGQVVWIWTQTSKYIIETKIETVGRKYITVEYNHSRTKFDKDTLREVGGTGYPSYIIINKEVYKKECYYSKLRTKFSRVEWDKIKEEDLDKIENILKI